jgi:hypothetical protein
MSAVDQMSATTAHEGPKLCYEHWGMENAPCTSPRLLHNYVHVRMTNYNILNLSALQPLDDCSAFVELLHNL